MRPLNPVCGLLVIFDLGFQARVDPVMRPCLHVIQMSATPSNMWTGFPLIKPIRVFRENFEDFFQSGKTGGFQPKSGKKISNQGSFFKTIFKPFYLRKNVFLRLQNLFSGAVMKLHLLRQYLHRLMSLRSHLKRINMVFLLKYLSEN